MKVNLIAFQDKAVKELRVDIADALDSYRRRGKTQVVSLQAPTGAGKTIIAASLIEDIYFGSTLADGTTFDEQPEAIFVWLSDSPELNAQSKQKIELKNQQAAFWSVRYHFGGIFRYGDAGGWTRLFLKHPEDQPQR